MLLVLLFFGSLALAAGIYRGNWWAPIGGFAFFTVIGALYWNLERTATDLITLEDDAVLIERDGTVERITYDQLLVRRSLGGALVFDGGILLKPVSSGETYFVPTAVQGYKELLRELNARTTARAKGGGKER